MLIGVLALQGDFAAHVKKLEALGQVWRLIKKPAELGAIDGLIMPGGESGALLKLMAPLKFIEALAEFGRMPREGGGERGKPIFGTCAGMILLAKKIIPEQRSLGLIDITVRRNAYGRQLDSFIASGDVVSDKLLSLLLPGADDGALESSVASGAGSCTEKRIRGGNVAGNISRKTTELVFIRAPQIVTVDSPQVETLISYQNQPMLVQQNNIIAASFHPELTADNLIYKYFLSICGENK